MTALDPLEIYCTYCGHIAVLIRHVGKGKNKKKEFLCNDCIQKEMDGVLGQQVVGVDNI